MDNPLLVLAAVVLAICGAILAKPSPFTTGTGGYASQRSIGARNHSGMEPIDVFGFRKRGW